MTAMGREHQRATLTVWDTSTGKREESRVVSKPQRWMGYGGFSTDMRWYANGDRVYSVGGAQDIALDVPNGWSAMWATISTDGRWIAQGFDERIKKMVDGKTWYDEEPRGVVVHEFATGKRVLTLPTGFRGTLRFAPDGRGLVVTNPETITRWDLITQKPVVSHAAPGRYRGSYGDSFASSLALSADGTRALTGHPDTTALVWDITPPARKSRALTVKEMEAAWNDLAGADAGKAFNAIWRLADSGEEAVKFLRAHLQPVKAPEAEQVKELIRKLGTEEFAEREMAEKELRTLGELVAPSLRTALKTGLSAEQVRRAEAILKAADSSTLLPGNNLRAIRAVATLEYIGSKEARDVLTFLATGMKEARLTREAKEALRHLELGKREKQ